MEKKQRLLFPLLLGEGASPFHTLHDVALSGIILIIQPNCVSAHHLRSSFLHLWATSVSGDFLKLH